jgi:hypothetical protein
MIHTVRRKVKIRSYVVIFRQSADIPRYRRAVFVAIFRRVAES